MAMYVIIVGGGKVGAHLARLLLNEGHPVKVVEIRRAEIPRLQADLAEDTVLLGDGTDPGVLEEAGVRQAQVVAAVSGSDETNLVVLDLARAEFGVPRTIARVNNPKNAWMFAPQMGVDVALNQADLMAHLIAEEMSLGDMITLLKLRKGQYSLAKECVLAAVIRKGELLIPRGDTVLEAADEVLAVVHASQAAALSAVLGEGR
jgi:trk system potassium uptake protein TrkA